jgi:hypothetical protein
MNNATTPQPPLQPKRNPATIRFRQNTIDRLAKVSARSNLSRSALIQLAVENLLDYEARPGKLLLPKSRTAKFQASLCSDGY